VIGCAVISQIQYLKAQDHLYKALSLHARPMSSFYSVLGINTPQLAAY
jgi:hypothetical protein